MVVFYLGASVPTSYTTSVDANPGGLPGTQMAAHPVDV